MAITTETRTDIIETVVGMFGAAPGASVLAELTISVEAGVSIADLTNILADSTVFKAIYPNFLTNEEFATNYLTNLLGSEVSAEILQEAVDISVAELNGGMTRGQLVNLILTTLPTIAEDDPNLGAAAAAFNNQVEVATYYSVDQNQSGSTLEELQAIVDDVTSDDDTVTTAKASVDGTANEGGTFSLTASIDALTGTKGNDTFNALETSTPAATLTALDSIDGGAGTDTLNVTQTTAVTVPTSATVTNVENAKIVSGAGVTANTTKWTGLESLTVAGVHALTVTASATTDVVATDSDLDNAKTLSVQGGHAVTVTAIDSLDSAINVGTTTAVSGAVKVVSTHEAAGTTGTSSDISVKGGTTVDITANLTGAVNNTITGGAIGVTGGASTTEVSVTQTKAATAAATVSGVVNGAVTITDVNGASTTKAGTIANVSLLGGYGNSTITSNALGTLALSGSGGTLSIVDNLTTATVKTLDLTVDALTGGAIDDNDNKYETINVHTGETGNSTVANITATSVKSLTVDGDKSLTLTSSAGMTALNSITVSGAAGFTSNAATGLGAVKTFTSTSTGNTSVTLDDTATAVTGGAGKDTITYEAAIGATATVSLAGGDDSLKLAAASAAGATIDGGDGEDSLVVADGSYVNGAVTYNSFEVADLSGIAASTLNMTNLASATKIAASAAFAGAANVTNIAAGTNVYLTAGDAGLATGALLTYDLKTDTSADAVTVNLNVVDSATKAASGKGDDSVNAVTVTELTANDNETITFATSVTNPDDKNKASDYVNTVTKLNSTDLTTINYTGDGSLTLSDINATALTKVDGSAATGKLNVTLDAGANSSAVAVLGGSAADTVVMTGNTAANNIIVGNGGGDTITLAAGGTKETVRYAADTDSVLLLVDTTTPAVTPVIYDVASGYDVITNFTTGEDKIELSSALGLGTGDARTAITGKGVIAADGGADTNAEIAATLQTLIGTGADFFNDGTTDRAVAAATYDDTTAAEDFVMLFIDTDADGDFTLGTDQAIMLAGIASTPVVSDIVFG
jgi:S-layer protein